MGSDDRLIRVDDSTVVRPAGSWTPAVHALLTHLHATGFDGAPRPVSRTADTEVLTAIPGETPGKNFVSPWSGDDQLTSVARLVRRYHDAAATFVPSAEATWQEPTSIPTVGTLVCHNDLYRGNVVFRQGRAVGLIDFDFAHPADPLWDLAVAAWHWVPLSEGWRSDVPRAHWPQRLRLFVDAYGLSPQRRHRILDCLTGFLRNVRQRAATAGRDTEQIDQDIKSSTHASRRNSQDLWMGVSQAAC